MPRVRRQSRAATRAMGNACLRRVYDPKLGHSVIVQDVKLHDIIIAPDKAPKPRLFDDETTVANRCDHSINLDGRHY